MLPMLEREVVERHKWVTHEELLDFFAVSQCTPGIIAVNTAILIGYTKRGFWGAVMAAAGVITPSFVIILVIAAVLQNFMHIPEVAHAFAGIRAAVAALICSTVIRLFKRNIIDNAKGTVLLTTNQVATRAVPLALCLSAFAGVTVFQISPVYVTIAAAVAGLILYGKQGTP